MLELTSGEWFVVVFLTIAVVSARYFPAAGEAIAAFLTRKSARRGEPAEEAQAEDGTKR
jgi:hypothetical protein